MKNKLCMFTKPISCFSLKDLINGAKKVRVVFFYLMVLHHLTKGLSGNVFVRNTWHKTYVLF